MISKKISKKFFIILWIGFLSFFLSQKSLAQKNDNSIESHLKNFHKNTFQMMQQLPMEITESGEIQERGTINELKVSTMLSKRVELRDKLIRQSAGSYSGIDSSTERDRPERLIEPDIPIIRNLLQMERNRLLAASPEISPWADSYWPTYKGLIATRYADSMFPNSKIWVDNYVYVQSYPATTMIAMGQANQLSPAEKYDYVMGDSNFTLTQRMWNLGLNYYQKYGQVETWMGICHGWAGASHMNAAFPRSSIYVTGVNGASVLFYPQDIKALQSMLWAEANVASRFVGDRCDISNPARDPYGRILDPSCLDVNPGTWHIAVVNQMALGKRSFVMDSTYDTEVWNYPVASYNYAYFNPQKLQQHTSMRQAMIPISHFTLDKFKRFRSPLARYIVGIYMDVTHLKAIQPHTGTSGNPTRTIRFVYDLELDESYNIVGGEWYSNAHPDFIWTFAKKAQAMAAADERLLSDNWNNTTAVPASWSSAAARASSHGIPLYSFIKGLTSFTETNSKPSP